VYAVSREHNAGRNVKMDNKSFESVAKSKYLGTSTPFFKQLSADLSSGNVCKRSVQNLLSSNLASKNIKIKNVEI